MQPFLFEPVLPFLCLAAALLAPIGAALLRRVDPQAPKAWSASEIIATSLFGLAGLVACLIFGLVLEFCAAEWMMRTAHGAGLDAPLTWLGMTAALLSGASRLAWQLTLLLGPAIFAMRRLTRWRPPPMVLRIVGAAFCAPLAGWLILQAVPLTTPATTVLALALIIFAAVLTLAWPRKVPTEQPAEPIPEPTVLSQPIAVRAAPVDEPITRVTRLPAALAASLKTLQTAPMEQPPTLPMPLPVAAPARLSEAAVRRARRSRRTL